MSENRVLPILFNTDMVCAILDGRKTTTRRIAKGVYPYSEYGDFTTIIKGEMTGPISMEDVIKIKSPYKPGDILYVRETWCGGYDGEVYFYLADKNTEREQRQLLNYGECKWHPSIHMPKEAARIWLKVKDIIVERLQDMNTGDIISEGVVIRPEAYNDPDNARLQARAEFKAIWDSTIKKSDLDKYGWEANPLVWVIEFERSEKPCEQKGKSQ